jgi:hypothetical protein
MMMVHAPAPARANQLVDRRVDAYSPPMPAPVKAADVEEQGAARERRRNRRDEIHDERQQEQLLAREAVGELPEERAGRSFGVRVWKARTRCSSSSRVATCDEATVVPATAGWSRGAKC